MVKKILILSLMVVAMGTADFRFGGVSSVEGKADFAN
jgi:hypothetical protein